MNVTREKAFFRLRDQLPPAPSPTLPLGRTWKPELIPKVREGLQALCSILPCTASGPLGNHYLLLSQPLCLYSSQLSLPWGMVPAA